MYELQTHFPFNVSPADQGKVMLTIEIDAIHVRSFVQMLDSLGDFFRIINNKAKVALAYSRAPKNREKAAKFYDDLVTYTVEIYKEFSNTTQQTPRECISSTLQVVKNRYPNASYDTVKQILTKSGDLKKNGYYKKNL